MYAAAALRAPTPSETAIPTWVTPGLGVSLETRVGGQSWVTLVWIQLAGPPCRASVSSGTLSSTSGCSNATSIYHCQPPHAIELTPVALPPV